MAVNRTANDLQIFKGSLLGKCHKVEAFLGEGGFGFVTKCRNTETDKKVAIKVNKNHPDVVRQARGEIAILKKLRCLDPDTCNIVRWNGFFFDKAHICLNFELLDQSLYAYMASQHKWGLPMTELRPVINQLAIALSHLRSLGIVHADLKPDNVMVVDRQQQPLKVKLIDFGLACPVSAVQPGVCVQTTWYRAPEVMLHIPFNEAIDMWSLGLVAAELATGHPLYPGEMDYDMLNFIIDTQGQPADYVLDKGMGTDYYFYKQKNGQQRWRFKTPEEFAYETGFYATETRRVTFKSLDNLEQLMDIYRGQHSEHPLLVDLVKRMLQLDADQRIKPLEVLQHPFFTQRLPQSSRPDVCSNMTDTEETPEVGQQSSSCQTAGPEIIRGKVARRLPQSSRPDFCIDMTAIEDETPEVGQQPSWYQTEGPEINRHRVAQRLPQSSRPDFCIDMTAIEEETPEVGQQPSWYQTEGPEINRHRVAQRLPQSSRPDICSNMTDTEETPEVSQQSSSCQTAGPEIIRGKVAQRLPQSSRPDFCIDMTAIEEETPEVGQQPSWYQTEGPEINRHRVAQRLPQSSRPDFCIDMTAIEEETPEVGQQPSWYQTEGPEINRHRVAQRLPQSSRPDICSNMTDTEETPEVSQQSSSCQTAGPEIIRGKVAQRLPQSSRPDFCIDMTAIEEETPEVGQQPSWYQTEGPEINRHRVAQRLPQSSRPDICSNMTDTEETPEVGQQSSSCQTAGPEIIRGKVARRLPQSSRPDFCIDMTAIEEETPEVGQQPSWYQTEGPDINRHRVAQRLPQSSRPDFCIDMTDIEEVDVQPETTTENNSWFRRFVRRITETFYNYFSI